MNGLTARQRDYLIPISSPQFQQDFQHFRLTKTPETLKEFVDLFSATENDDGRISRRHRLIWMTPSSFITPYCHTIDCDQSQFISISLPQNSFPPQLELYSETANEARTILRRLFETRDDYYTVITLVALAAIRSRNGIFGDDGLALQAIMSQNPARKKLVFCGFEFGPQDGRVLATGGKAIILEFISCTFSDKGESFVQALRGRPDETVGPTQLYFKLRCWPEALISNWNRYCNIDLSFQAIDFEFMHCQALAQATVRKLQICHCTLSDNGEALINTVRAGSGPKGLSLGSSNEARTPFCTTEQFSAFLKALQGNNHLTLLELHHYLCGELYNCADELSAFFRQNKTLTYFGTSFQPFRREDWILLFQAIATHPTLLTLDFRVPYPCSEGRDLTEALIQMTRSNCILQKIIFSGFLGIEMEYPAWSFMVSREDFERRVVPELNCNKFFPKLLSYIKTVTGESTKAGILAMALARLNHKLRFTYMLLHQNIDILIMKSPEKVTVEGGLFITERAINVLEMPPRKGIPLETEA